MTICLDKSGIEREEDMYIYKNGVYRISVRNLIEFVLRYGDIDNRVGGDINREEAMLAGARAHRQIQKGMGGDYSPEVPFKNTYRVDDVEICVEGRADGVIENEAGVVIDEIKGVYQDIETIKEARLLHRAQAMCYAYMYVMENDVDSIGVQITYCDMDTMLLRRFLYSYTREEIIQWYTTEVMEKFVKWIIMIEAHRKCRDSSITRLDFPFDYRDGQKKLVVDVYKVINRKKNLFIEAPTGSGKTISTIFPAVKAMGEGLCDKVFYLTAKTITRAVAKDTYNLLREGGLRYRSLTITAKEKSCLNECMECNPESCIYAKGHYDRVNDACYDMIINELDIDREVVAGYAKKHQVCPFELSLDASYWCDGIICDYNYVFDPNVYLKRFFGDSIKGEYVFLVDEAHNLVERGRQMYSASLIKEDLLELRRSVGEKDPYLKRLLNRCNKEFLNLKNETEGYLVHDHVAPLTKSLMALYGHIEKNKDIYNKSDFSEELTQYYFKLRHFLNMSELVDENYVIYSEELPGGDFMVKEFCVNPSANLATRMEKGNSTVFFSATLLPISYYKELLGDKEDYAIYANSIFDTSKRKLMIGRDVSSKYTRRNAAEYHRIAKYISEVAKAKQGNYFAFFPSYKYMSEVKYIFEALYGEEYDIISQSSNMTEEEREEFLGEFAKKRDKSLIGFLVIGGVFSEGIDMREDALIGNIIVGTGLPQVCTERELLRCFYDDKSGMGYEYSYIYPGMNKVLQAAGRLIRTENDTGVIALLDERFLTNQYRNIFPREWQEYGVVTVESVYNECHIFWEDIQGK